MEESEKRRERLRAMRMEAAQVDVTNYIETSLPNHLSNPLIESSATTVGQLAPCTAPRFDYYTNPMAAFSTSKKRGKIENQPVSDNYVPYHHNTSSATYLPPNFSGVRNNEMSPSTHQFHQYSPDQRTFYARGFSASGGHDSPAVPRPFPMDQGAPHMWRGPRRPFVNQFPSHPPMEMSSPSHLSGPRGNFYTNPNQDRANYHSSSPSPGYQGSFSPGGGSHGHHGNMTPSPRFGSGRGTGSHGRHSSSDKSPGPEQFYNASMLEDPWKVLQPCIWTTNSPLSNSVKPSESWISKFGTKKARVSDSSGRSSSQPSLAEYLAASFKEAVEDAPSV